VKERSRITCKHVATNLKAGKVCTAHTKTSLRATLYLKQIPSIRLKTADNCVSALRESFNDSEKL